MVEHTPKRMLTADEVADIYEVDYSRLVLNKMPPNTQFIAKITDKIYSETKTAKVEGVDTQITNYWVPAEYEVSKDFVVPMSIRIGKKTAERVLEKFKEGEYVEKRAFFTKSTFPLPDGGIGKAFYINPIFKEGAKKEPGVDMKAVIAQARAAGKSEDLNITSDEEEFMMQAKEEGWTKENFCGTYIEKGGDEHRAKLLWLRVKK